jgi:hypothetical protein
MYVGGGFIVVGCVAIGLGMAGGRHHNNPLAGLGIILLVIGIVSFIIGGLVGALSSDPVTERSAYPTNAPCTIASTNYLTITSGSLCSCPTVSPPASDKGNTKPV